MQCSILSLTTESFTTGGQDIAGSLAKSIFNIHYNMIKRRISNQEIILIDHLLKLVSEEYNIPKEVEELKDGNMGSIRFVDIQQSFPRKYLRDLIQVSYSDFDEIVVLVTLTLDNFNNLFELEFWKTDFSALIEYPRPEQVQITTT